MKIIQFCDVKIVGNKLLKVKINVPPRTFPKLHVEYDNVIPSVIWSFGQWRNTNGSLQICEKLKESPHKKKEKIINHSIFS